MNGKVLMLVLAAGLVACGGGDDDGDSGEGGVAFCSEGFEGGSSDWGCTSCSGVDPLDDTDDFDPAIDGRASTFTEFGLSSGGQMVISVEAPSGAFEAGSEAGALMRFPSGTFNTIGVQFRALFNGAVVSSSGGSSNTAVGGNVSGAGTDTYYRFTPQAPFDEIEAQISVSGNSGQAIFRVYEFCGDR